MPLTNQELRDKYLITKQDVFDLIDLYRRDLLKGEEELQAAWVATSDLVHSVSKKHYKRRQSYGKHSPGSPRQWYTPIQSNNCRDYDRHINRMLMFLQFCKENIDVNMPLTVARYQHRFMWLELIHETKSHGINLGIDDLSLSRQANTNIVRDLVTMLRLHRQIGFTKSVREVIEEFAYEYTKKNNKYPTIERLEVLANRYFKYIEARRFATPKLESDLPSDVFDRLT